MAGTLNGDNDAITGINVTPLVDIVLVLLIIFMATAHLIAHQSMKLSLPKVAHSDSQDVNAITVAMGPDRTMELNNTPVTRDELLQNLTQMVRLDPNMRVTLSADESVSWGDVSTLLDDMKGLGIQRIAADVGIKKEK
jgi:biopolymer transport protein ExbD